MKGEREVRNQARTRRRVREHALDARDIVPSLASFPPPSSDFPWYHCHPSFYFRLHYGLYRISAV